MTKKSESGIDFNQVINEFEIDNQKSKAPKFKRSMKVMSKKPEHKRSIKNLIKEKKI